VLKRAACLATSPLSSRDGGRVDGVGVVIVTFPFQGCGGVCLGRFLV